MNNRLIAAKTFFTNLKTEIAANTVSSYDSSKLFDVVKLYDVAQLEKAMLDLATRGTRQCFIVPVINRYANDRSGMKVKVTRDCDFALLVTDKDTREGTEAVFGEADRALGLVSIEDRLVDQLTGCTLDMNEVYITPTEADIIEIENRDSKRASTRKAMMLAFTTPLGTLSATTGPKQQSPR